MPAPRQKRRAPCRVARQCHEQRGRIRPPGQDRGPVIGTRQREEIDAGSAATVDDDRQERPRKKRRQQQAHERARHSDPIGNRLLIDVDERCSQHPNDQYQVAGKFRVQLHKVAGAGHKAARRECSYQPETLDLPPIKRRHADSQHYFNDHGAPARRLRTHGVRTTCVPGAGQRQQSDPSGARSSFAAVGACRPGCIGQIGTLDANEPPGEPIDEPSCDGASANSSSNRNPSGIDRSEAQLRSGPR